ncbi:hypothetical protein BHL90_09810 [Limosilactobacillus reuteri]|nr:hypothetical protein BHL90_09810 [Limosilactobacillus reuteri]
MLIILLSSEAKDRFKDLDIMATKHNSDDFLKYDLQRIRRYASYEGLISSPILDGQPKPIGFSEHDKKFIDHASYKEQLNIIKQAISLCEGDGSIILDDAYFKGELAYITYNKLNISSAAYSRHKINALVGFADCLYFLTKNFGEDCIDLRVKKTPKNSKLNTKKY